MHKVKNNQTPNIFNNIFSKLENKYNVNIILLSLCTKLKLAPYTIHYLSRTSIMEQSTDYKKIFISAF